MAIFIIMASLFLTILMTAYASSSKRALETLERRMDDEFASRSDLRLLGESMNRKVSFHPSLRADEMLLGMRSMRVAFTQIDTIDPLREPVKMGDHRLLASRVEGQSDALRLVMDEMGIEIVTVPGETRVQAKGKKAKKGEMERPCAIR